MHLVVTEKPSVAQAISHVIGAKERKDGYMEGNGFLVSWCVGHLVELAQPEMYSEAWKKWSYESLPMIPEQWQHEVKKETATQYKILKNLMHDTRVESVVCATDAGREGELIFRLVYEQAGCRKPMKRLWISSMEESAIRDGFENLKPGSNYDSLYQSALCRQQADWLVGLNGTRLFTVLYGGKAGNARDWAGRPTGKKRPDRDEYNCSRYDLGNQHFDDYCTTHLIRTAVVNELLLEAIKEVCDYAQNNEAEFMAQVCSASEDRQAKAAKAIRQRKQRSEKRTDELSRLIRKLYEDNVNGRLSDKLFEQMLHDFEAELEGLTDSITQDQQELDRISRETVNAEKFLALVKKYTDFSELTPAMINEFVEKILVHQAEGKGASRTQEVEIFFNFIGKVEIPRKEIELTEEEKAALAEQERRRAKKAEYNRRYMEKKRRQWKEQQEREKEQQEALELPAASTEKGERIA